MKWVKLHISLLNSQRFKRMPEAGKSVFPYLLLMVGREDPEGGALRGGLGPYSVKELASETGFSLKTMRGGIDACESAGLVVRHADGSYAIDKWDEKAGESSRDRTKKWRASRGSGDGDVTSLVGHRDRLEEDVEKEEELEKEKARGGRAFGGLRKPRLTGANAALAAEFAAEGIP